MCDTNYKLISQRINEIAQKHASEYPNIQTADPLEQLWAIYSTLEGTIKANEDLHKMLYKLQQESKLTPIEFYKKYN